MRKILLLLLFLLTLPLSAQNDLTPPPTSTSDPMTLPDLIGPLVYGEGRSDSIVFHDLGTGETWDFRLDPPWAPGVSPGGTGQLYGVSPNGCTLLFGRTDTPLLIDLQARTHELITLVERPSAAEDYEAYEESFERIQMVRDLAWGPAGEQILYGVREPIETRQGGILVAEQPYTSLYAYDLSTGEQTELYQRADDYRLTSGFRNRPSITTLDWLDVSTLRYTVGEDHFVLDLEDGTLRADYGEAQPQFPTDRPNFAQNPAPSGDKIAVYVDYLRFYRNIRPLRSDNSEAEQAALRDAFPDDPGIELYDVETGAVTYFDLDGQLVFSTSWSPDGQHLLVQTVPDNTGGDSQSGTYLYRTADNSLQSLETTSIFLGTEDGIRNVQWSADGRYASFYGSFPREDANRGWAVYDVVQERLIPLDRRFDDIPYVLDVFFSPVLQYESSQCR